MHLETDRPKPGNAKRKGVSKRSRATWVFLGLLALFSALPSPGKELVDELKNLGREAGKDYLEPVASSMGAAMNTGWFHRAPDKQLLGLDIDFGVVSVGGTFFAAPDRFSGSGTFTFSRAQAGSVIDTLFGLLENNPRIAGLSQPQRQALRDTLAARLSGREITADYAGPTAIGPEDSIYVEFQDQSLQVTIPAPQAGDPGFDTTITIDSRLGVAAGGPLRDLPFLPLVAPSLTVGTVFGSQATLRLLPAIKISPNLGKVSLFGFGVQHNLSYWMGSVAPIDLTLDWHGQWLKVENTFTSNAMAGGATVSKCFGNRRLGITPFAGAAFEKSHLESTYNQTFESPTGEGTRKVKFDIEGKNSAHYTLGCAFQFFHVNFSTDYNFAEYDSFSAGLMVML